MKKAVWIVVASAALLGVGIYESRYSTEMQAHIDEVNQDLRQAALRSTYSTGLIGSLQSMRDETDVANEILETHEYVHTIRDEMLARKIKDAAAEGVTVGGAIQSVIAAWPGSVD